MSYLCILDINLLLVTSYFLLFFRLLFCSVNGFLCCAKLLSLIRPLFKKNFAFVYFGLGDRSKKILLWFMSKCVLPVFFSGTFILSDVIFRFLNHIEFIYINIVWGNFLISLFHIYLSSFASTSYWRSCLFFTVHSFFLCHRLSIGVLFHFWTIYSVSFIYVCVFVPRPCCFITL